MYNRVVFERYLTEAEERQLMSYVGGLASLLARRDHAWMRLLRQTGIRVGSLAGLTVFDARQALKSHQIACEPDHAKGGRGYYAHANRRALQALRDLLSIRRELGHAEIPEAPLIMSRNHRGMSVRSFQARMRQWTRAAGLEVEASPHWFRHTLAKRLVARSTARDPLGIVQHALGQSARSSTAIYTFPDREDLELAMEEAS
jgi:site-specific recombinase XerD